MESIHNAILQSHPADIVLMLLFLAVFLFLVAYMLLFSLRVVLYKNPPAGKNNPLSLLLTFRNEEENLRDNLPAFLKGSHLNFEVVAVDNCSQDESASVLNTLKNEYSNLRVSSLKQQVLFSGKIAQNIALKAAQYDWVTFLPASAVAADSAWHHEVSAHLNNENQVLINYSNIRPSSSFFNLLYRVEFFFQQLKSFGFILNKVPFVLSQDNIIFPKQHYFIEGAYRGKVSVPFANLELVINSFVRKVPVSLLIGPATAIYKAENANWKDYVELIKKEHIIRKWLPKGTQLLLLVHEWAGLLFIPLAIIIFLRMPELWIILVVMSLCLIVGNLFIIKKMIVRLKEYKLFLPSFLLALLLPFLNFISRIRYIRYGRKKEWKIGN